MVNTKERRKKYSQKEQEDQTLEERKRAAYSEMGKLGGLARAKQMAENGFAKAKELKSISKKSTKEKGEDSETSTKKD